ncbi:hypothetical protein FGA82_22080 [Pseudomonas fluorescens]|uniref:hypothetical protein n=1 Tax=Pseudomonas fluorescens TaxID=294 RepID=UPI0011317B35|nr:hypothetical protein [Pseudomonas fluorescens]TMU73960.1 hypothetical protein FGA82_22080 [Pseudomonas fluorescens]
MTDRTQAVPSSSVLRPVTFTASQSQRDLANRLFDSLMSRLAADIDYLVFSSWEQTTGHLLEVAKVILTLAAIGLNTTPLVALAGIRNTPLTLTPSKDTSWAWTVPARKLSTVWRYASREPGASR